MIDLTLEHRAIVKRIFDAHMPHSDVRVFGSRVKGTAVEFSDLDIVLYGDARKDPAAILEVKNGLSESDLPFLVDVLDWSDLSPEFKEVIQEHNEPL